MSIIAKGKLFKRNPVRVFILMLIPYIISSLLGTLATDIVMVMANNGHPDRDLRTAFEYFGLAERTFYTLSTGLLVGVVLGLLQLQVLRRLDIGLPRVQWLIATVSGILFFEAASIPLGYLWHLYWWHASYTIALFFLATFLSALPQTFVSRHFLRFPICWSIALVLSYGMFLLLTKPLESFASQPIFSKIIQHFLNSPVVSLFFVSMLFVPLSATMNAIATGSVILLFLKEDADAI